MSEKKNALVISGGQWQVPLIRYLKEKNYCVHVADPNPDSPGVIAGDVHVASDIRDADRIKKIISDKKFHLITSDQSDLAIETVAILASEFNLKGNKPEAVKRFTNKFLSRQYASEQGIPVPRFYKASTAEETRKAIGETGLPVIIKPVDSQSSRGVFRIDDSNREKVDDFISLSFKESRQHMILVEEFIEGVELTVEGICSGGKHRSVAVSMKKHFRTAIASDLQYPAELPSQVEKDLFRYNDQYVENSGLDFGITHSEYLFDKNENKIYLVEIACRGGGTLISSDIAQWVSGVDLYGILLKDLNGISTDVKAISLLKRNALLHFFEFPDGIVQDIIGVDEIAAMPGIRLIRLEFKPGDSIKPATDDRTRQGFVIIYANSKEELEKTFVRVNEIFKIESTKTIIPFN